MGTRKKLVLASLVSTMMVLAGIVGLVPLQDAGTTGANAGNDGRVDMVDVLDMILGAKGLLEADITMEDTLTVKTSVLPVGGYVPVPARAEITNASTETGLFVANLTAQADSLSLPIFPNASIPGQWQGPVVANTAVSPITIGAQQYYLNNLNVPETLPQPVKGVQPFITSMLIYTLTDATLASSSGYFVYNYNGRSALDDTQGSPVQLTLVEDDSIDASGNGIPDDPFAAGLTGVGPNEVYVTNNGFAAKGVVIPTGHVIVANLDLQGETVGNEYVVGANNDVDIILPSRAELESAGLITSTEDAIAIIKITDTLQDMIDQPTNFLSNADWATEVTNDLTALGTAIPAARIVEVTILAGVVGSGTFAELTDLTGTGGITLRFNNLDLNGTVEPQIVQYDTAAAVDVNGVYLTDIGGTATDWQVVTVTPLIGADFVVDAVLQTGLFTVLDAPDVAAPVITLLGNNPDSVECGSAYTDPGATAADDRDGDVTANIVVTGSVDTATPGSYTLTYTVQDAAGNIATLDRTVNVVDNTLPTITLNGADPLALNCNDTFTDPGATASDVCDGDISANITVSGTVDATTPGSYTLTYSVTDAAGNTATATRTVDVADNCTQNVPVITLLGANPDSVECGNAYTDPGATATDVEDGDLTANITTTGTVDTATPGTYTLTYSVTDADSNTATDTRTVTVVDTTAPAISLNGSDPITVDCDNPFVDPGVTAVDSCDANVAVVTSGAVDTSTEGAYTLTYTATDASGNSASVTRTVNVVNCVVVPGGNETITGVRAQAGGAFGSQIPAWIFGGVVAEIEGSNLTNDTCITVGGIPVQGFNATGTTIEFVVPAITLAGTSEDVDLSPSGTTAVDITVGCASPATLADAVLYKQWDTNSLGVTSTAFWFQGPLGADVDMIIPGLPGSGEVGIPPVDYNTAGLGTVLGIVRNSLVDCSVAKLNTPGIAALSNAAISAPADVNVGDCVDGTFDVSVYLYADLAAAKGNTPPVGASVFSEVSDQLINFDRTIDANGDPIQDNALTLTFPVFGSTPLTAADVRNCLYVFGVESSFDPYAMVGGDMGVANVDAVPVVEYQSTILANSAGELAPIPVLAPMEVVPRVVEETLDDEVITAINMARVYSLNGFSVRINAELTEEVIEGIYLATGRGTTDTFDPPTGPTLGGTALTVSSALGGLAWVEGVTFTAQDASFTVDVEDLGILTPEGSDEYNITFLTPPAPTTGGIVDITLLLCNGQTVTIPNAFQYEGRRPLNLGPFFLILLALLLAGLADGLEDSDGGGGPCFIATAAYGTPMADDIATLRGVRDSYMLNNAFGTAFVDSYYRISPAIADAVAQYPALAALVRAILIPVVFLGKIALQMPALLAFVALSIGMLYIRRSRKANASA